MSLKASIRTLLTLGKGVTTGLPDAEEGADPFVLFATWFEAATESGLIHPEAMALGTASPDGAPSVRMVLLKEVDERGFIFFTNHGSRKGAELTGNPRASLCFHWANLERQVRVEGDVGRISAEESDAYFQTRPRGSRIGAWASRQSERLPSRADFDRRVRECEERFKGGEVPLPPFWGGYRVRPTRIEFWQGRASRLHDRLVFERSGDRWDAHRLYP